MWGLQSVLQHVNEQLMRTNFVRSGISIYSFTSQTDQSTLREPATCLVEPYVLGSLEQTAFAGAQFAVPVSTSDNSHHADLEIMTRHEEKLRVGNQNIKVYPRASAILRWKCPSGATSRH